MPLVIDRGRTLSERMSMRGLVGEAYRRGAYFSLHGRGGEQLCLRSGLLGREH